MMEHRPAIAVIAPSILTALGMKSILEKIIPMAEVEAFNDVRTLEESGMERYFHFFTATPLFVRHNALFRPYRRRVILLTGGSVPPELADMRRLDILRSEEELVHDIMRMHRSVHRDTHDPAPESSANLMEKLGIRSVPGLTLYAVTRGYVDSEEF